MKRKLWFTFQHGGTTWSVYLSNPKDWEGLECAQGYTEMGRAEVHISSELAEERRLPVFGHEIIHVMLANANPETMKSIFQANWNDGRSIVDLEERLASRFGPELMSIMLSAGLVKMPKVRTRVSGSATKTSRR